MADLVDIVLPADGQTAAEALGLKVYRSVTSGARVQRIPRDEAEIAVECLRDWGVSARIREYAPQAEPAPKRGPASAGQG
jgi:hydrogenase maturation factor